MNKLMVFLCCLMIQQTFCQPGPLSQAKIIEIKQKVREMARKTTTIESDFIQVKEMSVMAERIISKGKFLFKKEKKLRWEYLTPFPYLIIINQDQMLVRDENRENKINLQSSRVFREVNNIIMGAVQGTLLDDAKNFSSEIAETQGRILCKLTPLNAKIKESLGEVWLYFNKIDFSVDQLEMRETSGDYTRISFLEKKINQTIPDEKFALK